MQFKNFVLSSRFWMSLCLKIGKFYNHSWQFLLRFHFLTNFVVNFRLLKRFLFWIFSQQDTGSTLLIRKLKKRETKHIS